MAEPRVFAVDENFDFPAPVAARQAVRLGDATTAEGKALAAAVAERTAAAVKGSGIGNILVSKNVEEVIEDGTLLIVPETPRYFTDFSGHIAGSAPAGWTQPWATGSYVVQDDALAEGGKILRLSDPTGSGRRVLAWSTLASEAALYANQEIVFKWRGAAASVTPRAILRGAGAAGTETGLYGGRNSASSVNQIGGYVSGSPIASWGGAALTMNANQWYVTRFRIHGTRASMRTWVHGTPEPTTWDPTSNNRTEITNPGFVGLLAFNAGVTDFDWVGVAFDGGRAPMKAV